MGWLFNWIGHYAIETELNIRPVETVQWKWSSPRGNWSSMIMNGMLGGLLLGGLVGILLDLLHLSLPNKYYNPFDLFPLFATLIAAVIGFLIGLFNILGALVQSDISVRLVPNEGIRRSSRNSFLFLGLYGGISGILIYGLLGGLAFVSLLPPWMFALTTGLFGLYGGLKNGGIAIFQHLTLRFLLYCNGLAPWRYIRFLDQAVERVFLRKVGGGYIFVHRMLLEYFAALYPECTRQGQTRLPDKTACRQNNSDC